MRDLTINSSTFDKELEKIFSNADEKLTFLAEGKKAIIPTRNLNTEQLEKVTLLFNENDPMKLRLLAIRSWYISNPLLANKLRISILQKLRKSTIDFSERARIIPLLESKGLMLTYLTDCDDSLSAREWYGTYQNRLKTILEKSVQILKLEKFLPKVEKYTGYCRGYKSSPHQESLISQQAVENDIFIAKWQLLKSLKRRLEHQNEIATQLWILREFDKYKLIKDDLHYLGESYRLLKLTLGLDENQVENVMDIERLHRQEKVAMFKFN
jgi:hypothetical protein